MSERLAVGSWPWRDGMLQAKSRFLAALRMTKHLLGNDKTLIGDGTVGED